VWFVVRLVVLVYISVVLIFLKPNKLELGLPLQLKNAIAEQAEKFGKFTISVRFPIHQIPLFNTLIRLWQLSFPAIAPLIIHQTIVLGLCMLIAGYRERRWRAQPLSFLESI
jgi:ABC-2 type transport system permease protein